MGLTTTAFKRLILATAIAGLYGTVATPAFADMETLLDKLHEKGVLSDEDYQQMRTEARADRRAQALKEANDAEKSTKSKEESATTMTGKFKDGVSWESGDKSTAFSVNGRVQGDYRMYEKNAAPDTFDVRRAYLGAKGKFYNDITFNVTGDFANTNATGTNTSVQLDEAYVNFGWVKWAQLRVGQFQMPFSLEKITSDIFNNFQERNIGDVMSPDKLRGAQIAGSPTAGLYYGVAVANGNGAKNTNDAVQLQDGKELIGRVAVNFAEMFSVPKAVYHIGASYADTTQIAANSTVFSGRTEGRGISFFTASAFTGTPSRTGRDRPGNGNCLRPGEVPGRNDHRELHGQDGRRRRLRQGHQDLVRQRGLDDHGRVLLRCLREQRVHAHASERQFHRPRRRWGAWELGLRLSKWDGSDFRSGPAGIGSGYLRDANGNGNAGGGRPYRRAEMDHQSQYAIPAELRSHQVRHADQRRHRGADQGRKGHHHEGAVRLLTEAHLSR